MDYNLVIDLQQTTLRAVTWKKYCLIFFNALVIQ